MSIISYNASNNVYDALESELRRRIVSGALRGGQSLYSETQLARNYRISRSSVRIALGNLERDGLVKRVRGSGTFVVPPEERKVDVLSRRTIDKQVLFLSFSSSYSAETYLEHHMHETICNGLSRILQSGGYSLLLSHVGLNDELSISLKGKSIAGIIYSGRPTQEFHHKFLKDYTCVALGAYNPEFRHCTVEVAHVEVSRLAVEYLKKTGCRKIGFVSNECEEYTPKKRFQGFLQAMEELELEVNPKFLIQWQRPRLNGELTLEHGMPDYRGHLKGAFSGRERPDALVCIDDWRALCTMKALEKMGLKVPQDLSLIGSCTAIHSRPERFTSVCVRTEESYAQAARLLLDQLENKDAVNNITIKLHPELIIGYSTGKNKEK